MVTQITAYQASDGTLHADKISAARHDAKVLLMKYIGNEAFVRQLLDDPHYIVGALYPLCELSAKATQEERETFMTK